MVIFGLSGQRQSTKPKIDSNGAILAAIASSTLILTFSLAGTMYPWLSVQVLGLCVASIIAWIFFVKAEARAEEPILDLELMKNRSFVTIVCACILSSFGMVGLMIYYPLMMQGVQGATATLTGQVMTPGNVFMNFLGIPAGFLLARTRRYKGMFILGYGLTLAVMVFLIFFKGTTPISWGLVAISLAGIGMGAIPTLNTLVAQYAVPKRLLGVSMGALFFSVMLGQAIAPAILGSAMNMQYNSTLKTLLPAEVSGTASQATMTSIGNPKVLMSQSAMHTLRETLQKESPNGTAVAEQTVSAIRSSMEAGLRICYILGAIAMLLTFLTICTIPQISIDKPAE
jgi:MFS family permease